MCAAVRDSTSVHYTGRWRIVWVTTRDTGVILYVILQLDSLLIAQGLAKLFKVCLIQWMLLCHIVSAWALGYSLRLSP